MFKQRLLTALILIPLVLLTIKQANPWILAEFMAIILAIAAKEWFALIPLKQMLYKILFSILLIVSVYCCWIFYDVWFWTAMGMWCLVVDFILCLAHALASSTAATGRCSSIIIL